MVFERKIFNRQGPFSGGYVTLASDVFFQTVQNTSEIFAYLGSLFPKVFSLSLSNFI